MSISVVINTLNEEATITDCIRSVSGIATEIVVCDMHSVDDTVALATKLGAKIFFHERTGFVEPARYYAISQATCQWVLVIDADERMTDNLKNNLLRIVKNDSADVVLFGNLFNFFGGFVKYGGFFSLQWPRFFKKEIYLKEFTVSELLVHGNFGNLKNSRSRKMFLPSECHLIHEAYPTIEKYIAKTVGKYARIEAEQNFQKGKRFSTLKLIGAPCKSFILSFFIRKGYKDGVRGLILSVLYAIYRFSIHANLWFLYQKKNSK